MMDIEQATEELTDLLERHNARLAVDFVEGIPVILLVPDDEDEPPVLH